MPEFRFRRKKHRHTLQDTTEAAAQIEAAREKVKDDAKASGDVKQASGDGVDAHSTNTLTREREKFLELLKSKYPEHIAADLEQLISNHGQSSTHTTSPPMANGHSRSPQEDGPVEYHSDDDIIKTTSSSELPTVTASLARRISSRFNECIFLRYGSDLRHCPMPSPITLSTIRNLFVNMFDLSPSLLGGESGCQLFIKDKETEKWKVMEKTSMITNRCTVLLVDPAQGHTHPDSLADISPSGKAEMEREGEEMSGDEQEESGPAEGLKRNGLWRAGHQFDDLTTLSDTMPIHSPPESTAVTSPLSVNSSTSGVGSDVGGNQHQRRAVMPVMSRRAEGLRQNVHRLREELNSFRQHHAATADEFSQALLATKESITAAVRAFRKTAGLNAVGTEDFRRERLELYSEEDAYGSHSERTLHNVNVLECAVEGVRRDVVERRCKVDDNEVEGLSTSVQSATRTLQQLKERYTPLEKKLKRVMKQELQVIVKEERYIADESAKLQEAWEKCTKLTEILGTLRKFSTVQSHRTPHIPMISTISNPDRQALMENIAAITPNHLHRMECIELAEEVQRKRKELTSPKHHIRMFENQLQVQHDLLRHTRNTMDLEKRREMKLRAYYLSEKFEREKQLAQELELQKKMAEQKRESEKRAVQEHWLRDQQHQVQDKRSREQDRKSKEQDKRSREQDRRSREVKSHKAMLLNAATEKGTAPNPAFAQNNFHPPHKSHAARVGNGLPHTGRASLAPHTNLQNFPPRDRKSIGYSGEYDTLEPAHSLSQPEMPVAGDSMPWNHYPSRHVGSHRVQGFMKHGAPGISTHHHRLSITSSSNSSNSQGSQAHFQHPQAPRDDGSWNVAGVDDSQRPVNLRKGVHNGVGPGKMTTKKRSTVHEAMLDQRFYVDDFTSASLSQPELEMRQPFVSQNAAHNLGFTQKRLQRATSDDSIYNLDEVSSTDRKATNPQPQSSRVHNHIPVRQHPHGRANVHNRYSYQPTTGDFMMQLGARQPATGASATAPPESTQQVASTASSSKTRNKQSGAAEKMSGSPQPKSPSPVIHHSYTKFASNPRPKSPTTKKNNPQITTTKASASLRGGKAKKSSKQQPPPQQPSEDLKNQTGQLDPKHVQLHQTGQSDSKQLHQPNLGGNVDRAPTNSEGLHWTQSGNAVSASGANSRQHHPPPPPHSHPHKSAPSHPHHHIQSYPHTHGRQAHIYHGIDEPLTSYPRFHSNAGAPHGHAQKTSRLSGNPGRGPPSARLPIATKTGYPSTANQREPMGSLV